MSVVKERKNSVGSTYSTRGTYQPVKWLTNGSRDREKKHKIIIMMKNSVPGGTRFHSTDTISIYASPVLSLSLNGKEGSVPRA